MRDLAGNANPILTPSFFVSALVLMLSVAGVAKAVGLPDSGQDTCYDGSAMVACDESNTGDAANYPAQDGRYGRDAAASVGQLSKIGGGEAGFDYTRVCNSGELAGVGNCLADPVLGSGADDWGCTRDNITGLIWEVKVDDDTHLRHKDWSYSWYNSDGNTNAGSAGLSDGGDDCYDTARCDTEKFATDVNAAGLCGQSDWRLPSIRELNTLVHYGAQMPAIDTSYFPNVFNALFWSASSYVASENPSAWVIQFSEGQTMTVGKTTHSRNARLVRGGQF